MGDAASILEQALAPFQHAVGTWDAEMEIRPYPGAELIRSKGECVSRLSAGRWFVTDWRTESGFAGHGVYGWDDKKGIYVGIWVDSMSGVIARSEGSWDEATRTLTYLTEQVHGERRIAYRELMQAVDENSRLYRQLMPTADGGEHEQIRISYRRRA